MDGGFMNTLLLAVWLTIVSPQTPQIVHFELQGCEGLVVGNIVTIVDQGTRYKVKVLDVHGDCHINGILLDNTIDS